MKYPTRPVNKLTAIVCTVACLNSSCYESKKEESIDYSKKDQPNTLHGLSLKKDDTHTFFLSEDCDECNLVSANDSLMIAFCLNQKPKRGYYCFIRDTNNVFKFYKRVYDKDINDFATDEFIWLNKNGQIIEDKSFFISINDQNYYSYVLRDKSQKDLVFQPKLNLDYKNIQYELKSSSGKNIAGEFKGVYTFKFNFDTKDTYNFVFKINLNNSEEFRTIQKRIIVN
ncbi:MAG TPA: hypothetical protein VD905_21905 [Flavobacteriales bacterium]|nr:hypothetical protein [Flavobacteriales bacterium]